MRIRQVVVRYWQDAVLFKNLSAAEREFYIGLWMEADDGGWFRLDIPELAADLYRYEPSASREAQVADWLKRLEGLGRVVLYGCGHAQIPTLARHQRLSGETRRVYTIRDEHSRCASGDGASRPADSRGSPPGTERNGTELERERFTPNFDCSEGTLERVVALVESKWGWTSVSESQKALILDVADHLDEGSRGLARACEILRESAGDDPIRVLLEYDRRLKSEGLTAAERQEAESRRWKQIGARTPANRPASVKEILDGLVLHE